MRKVYAGLAVVVLAYGFWAYLDYRDRNDPVLAQERASAAASAVEAQEAAAKAASQP